eukprot:TRINITY_DN109933_c0_g1_i1.p1 TRINITY_DN109933_c0_g1~~TRINITY_DN109933_c0_g1_i1.p1  ORF type:complete len:375 (+),score=108.28 TRINITY_DN109933_c0_g1_i1:75-1199(+)
MAQTGLSSTVKSWNGQKGFGFIEGAALGAGDIFFGRAELPPDIKEVQGKFLVGRPVVFDSERCPDGKTKATAVAVPYVEGQPLAGSIKSFSAQNQYGFITSSSLTEDVRFNKTDLPDHFPGADLKGALVTFEVTPRPDGKLLGTNVRFQSKKISDRLGGGGLAGQMVNPMMMGMMGGGMAGGMNMAVQKAVQEAQAQGLQTGTVKSYADKNGYGFITVPGFPQDVKFGKTDLAGGVPNAGDSVSFVPQQSMDGRVTGTNVAVLGAGGTKRNAATMMGGMMMGGMGMMGAMMKKPKVEETLTGASKQGMIKTYNNSKGFGFIAAVGVSGDVFFMKTSLPQEAQNLQGDALQGKGVSFQVSTTADGKVRAQNITFN